MRTDERLKAILDATPEQLAAIDAALSGDVEPDRPPDLRLLRVGQVAKLLAMSRTSVWRLCTEKRLPTVEVRRGSRRIPAEAVRRFAGAGK